MYVVLTLIMPATRLQTSRRYIPSEVAQGIITALNLAQGGISDVGEHRSTAIAARNL